MLTMLAACPPAEGITSSGATESSGETTDTTTGGSEEGPSDPTMNTTLTSTETMPSSGSMSDSDSDSDTSATGPNPTSTGPGPECRADGECDEAAPFCVDGTCVTCDATAEPDVSCSGLDAEKGVCGPDGACVTCTAENVGACSGNTPVCDDANACAACTLHSQCGETACNLETGACFAPEYVIYVDKASPCDVGVGTMEAPFCKIGEAFTKMLGDDVTLGWTIKIASGNYIEEPLIVPDGALVTLTRWGDSSPKIKAVDDTGATLSIQNASSVFIDRLAFNANSDYNAIVCAGSKVWIDDSRMATNKLQGYESTDCETKINRSVVYDNDGGGVASYGAGTTTITNSFITGNGTQNFGEYGGIRTAQGNELHLVYSTVVNNLSETGPRSLQCVDAGAAEIRNSVLIGFAPPSIDCPGGVFTGSAIDEGAVDGDGNLAATVLDIMAFFNPQMAGVYTAKADTGIATIAKWKDGDPKTDFDGTARPNTDGADDYAGADRP